MIGILMAQKYVARFSGLDWYVPAESREAAREEVVKAMQTARDEPVAAMVSEQWLESEREWPKPADVRRLISEWNAKTGPPEPNLRVDPKTDGFTTEAPDCALCGDAGLVGGDIGGTADRPWDWCGCQEGRRKQLEDPAAVDSANEARRRLIDRLGKHSLPLMLGTRARMKPEDFA